MKGSIAFIAAVAALLFSYAAGAEEVTRENWTWKRGGDCTAQPNPDEPGGTPLNPIKLKKFDELFEISLNRNEHLLGTDPVCRWVELSGLYRWEDPFGYHGSLIESFPKHLREEGARYLISTFLPKDTRAGDFHSRHVTFVGRFYHLCVPYRKIEPGQNVPEHRVLTLEDGTRLTRSECSSWRRRTLVLRDVFVTEVKDEAPLYISGERNRPLISELMAYEAADLDEFVSATRRKIRLLQDSVEAYADAEVESYADKPQWKTMSPETQKGVTAMVRGNIMRTVSYETTLAMHPAFQQLNAARAVIRVFSDTRTSSDVTYGCVCLRGRCKDQWPLYRLDADHVIDPFACFKFQEFQIVISP